MSLATTPLPADPETLRLLVARLQNELYAKTLHVEKLRMELALGDLEEDAAQERAERPASTPTPQESRPAPRGRQPLPAHLPRERAPHPSACVCPACGTTRLVQIGTDEREVLEYLPSHLEVLVHVRPKISCRQCETIAQPPMPPLPIERGRPGPALLAHVLVAKYADHRVPRTHRQRRRCGAV